ncbi:hypothetical protein MKY41_09190 [Sporosarcina sp. FSL W7-1349]|uniref:hypothetical protein n=1 Tax=Sporosarcina sp. FSL W7-1349 TaxID=2921561 RepID=UPI0030FB2947
MTEMVELIDSYNEYIKKIPKGCQTIADQLRVDTIVEAMRDIVNFSEGANWLLRVSSYLKENNISVELPTEKIHEFLNEINQGLEIQDYIVVADMFEYEIRPFFEEYVNEVKLEQ